jgi:magnesium transporter
MTQEKDGILPDQTISSSETNFTVGISQDNLKIVHEALESGSHEAIFSIVTDLHAADVADLIERLSHHERHEFIELLRQDLDAEVFQYLEEKTLEEVVTQLGTRDVAAAMADLDPDEAVTIIEEFDEDRKEEVLRALTAEDRAAVEKVLSYPENSAGRLMRSRMAVVKLHWTISQVIDFMAVSQDLPDEFFKVFVVDDAYKPLGLVSLSAILKAPRDEKIEFLIEDHDLKTIPILAAEEDVATLFKYYGLVSAPVIDEDGRLVGMITVDDVVEVIEEEAEKEILHIGGVGRSDFHAGIYETVLLRLRWLLVALVNSFLAVYVVSHFEQTLSGTIALAVLMPIVAGMGSSAGMQVVTVIVRAIATDEMRETEFIKPLLKEVGVAFLIGIFFGLIFGSSAYFWQGRWDLALVLFLGLILNMLWGAFAGVLLPVIIARIGFDPALSSGPILTSSTDVLGFGIFLSLAVLILS